MGFTDSSVGKQSTCNAGYPGLIPGLGRSPGEGIGYPLQYSWVSLVTQLVKNPPAMPETWVQSLGWKDPLEKGKATHSGILAWRIPWTVQPMGLQTQTQLSDLNFHFHFREGWIEEGTFKQQELELADLETSQPVHIARNMKACTRGNTTCVIVLLPLSTEFERLCEQKHCQSELKGAEAGWSEGSCQTPWTWQDRLWSYLVGNMHYSACRGENVPSSDSEITGATASISAGHTGLHPKALRARLLWRALVA